MLPLSLPVSLSLLQDHLYIVLIALAANILLAGEWLRSLLYHINPMRGVAGVVRFADARLNREKRPDVDRAVRGALLVLIFVPASYGLGKYLEGLIQVAADGWMYAAALLTLLLPVRQSWDVASVILTDLPRQSLRSMQAVLVRELPHAVEGMDDHALCRSGIEACVRGLSGVLLPMVIWYVPFGFSAALCVFMLASLYAMLGDGEGRYNAFASVLSVAYGLCAFIPFLLGVLLIATGAIFTPGAAPVAALRAGLAVMVHHPLRIPYYAMAAATGANLGGPRKIGGKSLAQPWIGEGTSRVTLTHLRMAKGIFRAAVLLFVLALAGLYLRLG